MMATTLRSMFFIKGNDVYTDISVRIYYPKCQNSSDRLIRNSSALAPVDAALLCCTALHPCWVAELKENDLMACFDMHLLCGWVFSMLLTALGCAPAMLVKGLGDRETSIQASSQLDASGALQRPLKERTFRQMLTRLCHLESITAISCILSICRELSVRSCRLPATVHTNCSSEPRSTWSDRFSSMMMMDTTEVKRLSTHVFLNLCFVITVISLKHEI